MNPAILTLHLSQQTKCGRVIEVSRRLCVDAIELSKYYVLADTYRKLRLELRREAQNLDNDDACPHDK